MISEWYRLMVKYWAKEGETKRIRVRLRIRMDSIVKRNNFGFFFIDFPYCLLPSAMHHVGCMAALNLTWFRAHSALRN